MKINPKIYPQIIFMLCPCTKSQPYEYEVEEATQLMNNMGFTSRTSIWIGWRQYLNLMTCPSPPKGSSLSSTINLCIHFTAKSAQTEQNLT